MATTPTRTTGPVTPELLEAAAALSRTTLERHIEADWALPAGPLEWTCRETIDHVLDAVGYYCGQLATRAERRMPPFRDQNAGAQIAELVTTVTTGAAILAAIARSTPAEARAYHRMGMADAEGFLAMAGEEILIHTWDICQGFGEEFSVPEEIAGPIVARLFPWAPAECTAWEAQLWCSDRIALSGRGRIERWGWHAAPLAEWAGGDGPERIFEIG